MKWFNNLKVGRKVLLSCVVFIIMIIVIAGQGIIGSTDSSKGFHKFYEAEFTPIRELNRIMRNLLQIRINMLQQFIAVQNNNTAEIVNRRKQSEELRTAYLKDWTSYKSTLFSEEGKKLAAEWDDLAKAPYELRMKFDEAIDKKDIAVATDYLSKWADSFRLLRDKTDEMIIMKNKFAQESLEHQDAETRMTIIIDVIVLLVAVVVGFIITIILSGAVSKPVAKGLAFAQLIAKGDFTERIDLDQEDELGQLGKALNVSADNLEELISNIIVATQNLAQAVEQIASGNQNLSQRTSEQASSLEEIASTIEETTATINQNADNATDANKQADKSSVMAQEGGKLVSDAVVSINEINQVSKKIGEIISVINEIAFQTNLLALNAAVEAARAGEQGRGFAVVAGEVRNLAQRSGNAAKEIGDLIKNSIEKIEVGTDKANKSGEALNEIIASVKNVGNVISEIAAASVEQKQGINQINIAVTEMDTMTQQNAALVEETASASEEMANQAQELLVMMERFKIRDDSRSDVYKKKHREIHLNTGTGTAAKRTQPAAPARKETAKIDHKPAAKAQASGGNIKNIMSDDGFEEF
jgi:methyl-accepting chemotaxis protein